MSNINQNNFNNCLNLRLSNSDYWDLFICNDCGCGLDHEFILDECLIVDINIDVDECVTDKTLCSLVSWSGDTCFESLSIPKSGVTLNDIGLTGIDNGFITYDCNSSTTGSTFIDTYTGSSITISSADTKFCFTRVSGCTYDYTYNFVSSANTVGRYIELCGGFYQGFFKLSDRTFFKNISDNMFVWPIDWFTCPPSCGSGCTSTNVCDTNCNNNINPIFIPGSTGVCDGKCTSNCQLCGTIYAEEYVGGCGPWCKDCGGKTCEKTGTTVTEKYITGVTVNEEYSEPNIIPDDEWFMLNVRFCAYEDYSLKEIKNVPRRKGRLDFFVNGYLKYSIENFDEFIFKDLFEYREKQEGVPFNYSLGGGTQGLIETNTIGGPDPLDENLIIQNNFAGTFIGDISRFRLYECCLDITTIRYRFKELCLNYGICPQELLCYIISEQDNIISSEDGDDFLVWCSE